MRSIPTLIAALTMALAPGVPAQEAVEDVVDEVSQENGSEPEPVVDEEEALEAVGEAVFVDEDEADVDGSIDDAEGSIEDAVQGRGWSANADLRANYNYADLDLLNPAGDTIDNARLRWRVGGSWRFTDRFRLGARLAGLCSTDDCNPEFILQPDLPARTSIDDGQITLDELYLHFYRTERFDVAAGRLQTKFVARGGVFAKSMDRNDSNNQRVNWTDGLHSTFRAANGWASHLVLQHNSEDGPSSVREFPLDFADSRARWTGFLAFENLERQGFILQRALDISYLPKSLLKDGLFSSRREDYYGIVLRGAGRWPMRSEGPRLRVSAEIGYAPETQTKAAEGIAGGGDVGGMAFATTISVMDFLPRQSIGINFARTDPGWLLSPQYRKNQELFEIRYLWRRNRQVAVDIRGRWRKDLREITAVGRIRHEFDIYLRVTRGFEMR